MTTVLTFLAAAMLGVVVGALLTEALVLLPFWRSLTARSFFEWYRGHGDLLLRFFGPLEVLAALLVAFAAAAAWIRDGHAPPYLLTAALLCIVVLVMFPLYFRAANASFTAGSVEPDRLADELRRWGRWHWSRVCMAAVAFAAALFAM
jgi:hypothetical protein